MQRAVQLDRAVRSAARRKHMPDEPERLAILECAICGSWIEVYRPIERDEPTIAWKLRGTELCPHRPLARCSLACNEVRRRFPGEVP